MYREEEKNILLEGLTFLPPRKYPLLQSSAQLHRDVFCKLYSANFVAPPVRAGQGVCADIEASHERSVAETYVYECKMHA
eukprot:scaffold8372_cov88-Skeletonema_dohrnii-CCMP3373.AAC.9